MQRQIMSLDFQALVKGEKISTSVPVKFENADIVQGIVEQELSEIHYKAEPDQLLDTIVIDFLRRFHRRYGICTSRICTWRRKESI